MSKVIQETGWAAKLFSSTLFCLWLSIGSVTVWFDLQPAGATVTAEQEQGLPASADATPASDLNPDAA